MSVAENIKYIRKQKNMTQKQLAEKTGLAVITIQQYEAGKYLPKFDNIVKLATALDCNVSDIRELDGSIRINIDPDRIKQDSEAKELIKRQASGEDLTEEEQKKISDYGKRIKKDMENLPKLRESIKNFANVIGEMGENILLSDYRKLNTSGKAEAQKRVNELTEISRYTKTDEPPQE